MRFALALVIAVLLAGPDRAGADDPCRAERQPRALAACLGHLADRRDAAVEARIAVGLAGLQAADAATLRALGAQYRRAQARWRAVVGAQCAARHPADAVARAHCRLEAVEIRARQVALSLDRAAADLGGPAPPALDPEYVELLLPLELPGGPKAEARLPVAVPMAPPLSP